MKHGPWFTMITNAPETGGKSFETLSVIFVNYCHLSYYYHPISTNHIFLLVALIYRHTVRTYVSIVRRRSQWCFNASLEHYY